MYVLCAVTLSSGRCFVSSFQDPQALSDVFRGPSCRLTLLLSSCCFFFWMFGHLRFTSIFVLRSTFVISLYTDLIFLFSYVSLPVRSVGSGVSLSLRKLRVSVSTSIFPGFLAYIFVVVTFAFDLIFG